MEFYLDSDKLPAKIFSAPKRIVFGKQLSQDLTLPDFCVDIARIIDSSAKINIFQFNKDGGKIYVTGETEYTILYLSEKDEKLHKFTFEQEYEAVYDAELNDCAEIIKCSVSAKEPIVKLGGTRKLSVRLDCEFSVFILNASLYSASSYGENTEVLKSTCEIMTSKVLHSDKVKLSEDIELPESFDCIDEILSCDMSISNVQCRQSSDKILVCADAAFTFVFSVENGNVESYNADIPVTAVIPSSEADDSYNFDTDISISGLKYGSGINQMGQNRIISLDFEVRADAVAYKNSEFEYLADAYSTAGNCELEESRANYAHLEKVITTQINAEDKISDESGEIESILSIRSKSEIRRTRAENGKFFAEGNCDLVIFAKTSVGAYAAYEHSIPFEYSCKLPTDTCEFRAYSKAIKANWEKIGNEYKISVKNEVNVIAYSVSEIKYINKITVSESKTEKEGGSAITVYYPDESETLWSIAKAHGVPQARLAAANNIEQFIPKGKKFILIPKN